ncbi:MAG: NADP-dependent malic enzyme [bacterium]|nr:NADP-dependent malic enzyme [bacterium]
MDYSARSLQLHKEKKGKIETGLKVPIENKDDLSLAYTPGVGGVSSYIHEHPEAVYTHTIKGNTVAVVTDGSAVLGLGNIGPEAALPVMEGKAALFKRFANVDAVPICLSTQETDEIIETVRRIAPGFGGINLEDISAPRCFEIEERLQDIGIPVFHDDQHGTAIVVAAGLLNAATVVGKKVSDLRVVINGSGAAGVAIATLLSGKHINVAEIVMCDSKGVISALRNDLNERKQALLTFTNKRGVEGTLEDAIKEMDVFIGVSAPGVLTAEMIKTMNTDTIVFAMANPIPEIMPDVAKQAGVAVMATGRSDFPNQVNNVLAFPGIFRGALDARASRITDEMKYAAVVALAALVTEPTAEYVIVDPFEEGVAQKVAEAVKGAV